MAEILENLQKEGIHKKIIYPGVGEIPQYVDGTRVIGFYSVFDIEIKNSTSSIAKIIDFGKGYRQPSDVYRRLRFSLKF